MTLAYLTVIMFALCRSCTSLVHGRHRLELVLIPSGIISTVRKCAHHRLTIPTRLGAVNTSTHHRRTATNMHGPQLAMLVINRATESTGFSLGNCSQSAGPRLTDHNILDFAGIDSYKATATISLPYVFLSINGRNCGSNVTLHERKLLSILRQTNMSIL